MRGKVLLHSDVDIVPYAAPVRTRTAVSYVQCQSRSADRIVPTEDDPHRVDGGC